MNAQMNKRKADPRSTLQSRLGITIAVMVLLSQAGARPATAAQPPSLGVSPSSGLAGSNVTLLGDNWQGNINATVRWDGVDRSSFNIQQGGSFATPFKIPEDATPGNHTITVCLGVPCPSGEFYVGFDVNFTVETPPPPAPPEQPSETPPPPPQEVPTVEIPPSPVPLPNVPTVPLQPPVELSSPEPPVQDLQIVPALPADTPASMVYVRCSPSETATVLDFDDSPWGRVDTDYYNQGILFSAVGGGMIAMAPEAGTYTPPAALKHDPGSSDFGSFDEAVSIQFNSPQNTVGMFVGLDDETDQPVIATLTAYDGAGTSIAMDSVQLGPGLSQVNVCMIVRQPTVLGSAPQIISVELAYDGAASEVLDHLFFSRDVSPVPVESGEVIVDIRGPVEGSELLSARQPVWGVVTTSETICCIEIFENRASSDSPTSVGRAGTYPDASTEQILFYLNGATLSHDAQSLTVVARAYGGTYGEDTVNVHLARLVQAAITQNFNVRVGAVEVTQGLRGDIPTFSEGGTSVSENGVHVADRRTIVRVYPDLAVTSGTFSGGLSARLIGSRRGATLPGSPLSPETPLLEIDPTWTLSDMRRDATRSWNFVLPDEWVQEGSINLTIEVNPAGSYFRAECPDCGSNNINYLIDVPFRPTGEMTFYPYIVMNHPVIAGTTTPVASPTLVEIATSLNWVWRTWPLPNEGLSVPVIRLVQASCTDAASASLASCGVLDAAVAAANAQRTADNILPGSSTLLPIIVSPTTFNDCGGRAGMPFPVFWAGACGRTVAQEAWHAGGGVNHAGNQHGELNDSGSDPGYPDNHGGIESNAYGFDVVDIQAIPPDDGAGNHTHDFMSYGGAPQWVSIYTWQNIANWLGASDIRAREVPERYRPDVAAAPSIQSPANGLRLSGQINPDGAVVFDTVWLSTLPEGAAAGEGEGNYRIEVRDASGNVLFTRLFQPVVQTHTEGGPLEFHEDVPLEPGLAGIVLFEGDTELARLQTSPGVPQISLLSPLGGEQWTATGTTSLGWQASDGDGDTLAFLVETSPDAGQTWYVLARTTVDHMTLDLSTVPGSGEDWLVRVQASDGVNVSIAEVGGISVAAKPPQPLIIQPVDTAVISPGAALMLTGLAADVQDGQLPDAALEWSVDGIVVGHGSRWPAIGLAEGQHIIGLKATNQAGLVGLSQISIYVGEGPAQPGGTRETDLGGLLARARERLGLFTIVIGAGLVGLAILFALYVFGRRRKETR